MTDPIEVLTRNKSLAEGPMKPEVVLGKIVKDSYPMRDHDHTSRWRAPRFLHDATVPAPRILIGRPDSLRTSRYTDSQENLRRAQSCLPSTAR